MIGSLSFAPTATAATVALSDDFENGDAGWSYYSNGLDASQQLVSTPTHNDSAGALQGTATADPSQPEIGIAHIREGFSVVEENSVLSWWYMAQGDAQYRSLEVEARTADGADFSQTVPAGIQTGAWTHAAIAFTDINPALRGQTIVRFVIKAVTAPDAGTAEFTIDDVAITQDVIPPLTFQTLSPAAGSTNVPRDQVMGAYTNTDLDPASVASASVSLTTADGLSLPATAFYSGGQRAVEIVPTQTLPADTSVTAELSGVQSVDGAAMNGPLQWTFTTGSASSGDEQVWANDLESTAWTTYSNADTSTFGFIPGRDGDTNEAYQGTATGANPFVVSFVRNGSSWLDEGGTLRFWYSAGGTAVIKDVLLVVNDATGYQKILTLPTPTTGWTEATLPITDISPFLVGKPITSVEIKLETTGGGDATFAVDDPSVDQTSLKGYSSVPPTPKRDAGTALSSPVIKRISSLAAQIIKSQEPDGSIMDSPTAPANTKLDPYAANYAALGLIDAYAVTHKKKDLQAADAWLTWYRDHMDADGIVHDCSGVYPNYVCDLKPDSVDSYASTYLLALYRRAEVTPSRDRASYVASMWPTAQLAAHALDLVYESDGNTIALTPEYDYQVRFAMDNAETYSGLIAYSKLAKLAGQKPTAKLAVYQASRTLYSLDMRYPVAPDGHLTTSFDADGTQKAPLAAWYPDALATVLPLSHIGSAKDATLFNALVQQVDVGMTGSRPTAPTDTPQYMWWAQAALRVGEPDVAQHFVDEYTSIEGEKNPATFAITAGHLIRVLAYPELTSLWY